MATFTPTITATPLSIGPVVTAFGIAEASGAVVTAAGIAGDGTPIFTRIVPQGFLVFVEAKPGATGRPIGGVTFNSDPGDSNALPDLQIVSSRPLGNGSFAVCDSIPGNLGGVPATEPPVFGGSQAVANALNDFACRFDVRRTNSDACTLQAGSGDPRFVGVGSTAQFCSSPGIGSEVAFPVGDTRLTVRIRDNGGFPGLPKSLIVRVR